MVCIQTRVIKKYVYLLDLNKTAITTTKTNVQIDSLVSYGEIGLQFIRNSHFVFNRKFIRKSFLFYGSIVLSHILNRFFCVFPPFKFIK